MFQWDVLNEKTVSVTLDGHYDLNKLLSLVDCANRFDCELLLKFDGIEVNAKSILSMAAFLPRLKKGTSVRVIAKGTDEDQALEHFVPAIGAPGKNLEIWVH